LFPLAPRPFIEFRGPIGRILSYSVAFSRNPIRGLASFLFHVITAYMFPESCNQVGQSDNDNAAITDRCNGILTNRAAKLVFVRKFEREHRFF